MIGASTEVDSSAPASRIAEILDRLLWRSVLRGTLSVVRAITLARELATIIPPSALIAAGSTERN